MPNETYTEARNRLLEEQKTSGPFPFFDPALGEAFDDGIERRCVECLRLIRSGVRCASCRERREGWD
jgi:hypothetical protein